MDGLTVIVPAIAVLVGVWLGSKLNRKSEHDAWLRNQRMDTYARLLGVLHESLGYASNDMWFNSDPVRHSELCKRWGELRSEMERIESEVTLVGPADVTEAAQRAVFAMESIGCVVRDWRAIRGVQTQTAELRETNLGRLATDAEETFVKVAAKAVGNPPPRRPPRPSVPPKLTAQFIPDWPPARVQAEPTASDSPNETSPNEDGHP